MYHTETTQFLSPLIFVLTHIYQFFFLSEKSSLPYLFVYALLFKREPKIISTNFAQWCVEHHRTQKKKKGLRHGDV